MICDIKAERITIRRHLNVAGVDLPCALLCALGYNVRSLLRMIFNKGPDFLLFRLFIIGFLIIRQKWVEIFRDNLTLGSDPR